MNDNSMGCSTLERYSMITHLLSSINVSDCISEDSEHLMNIEEIKNADVDTLAGVDEIPESVAKGIYDFFHSEG